MCGGLRLNPRALSIQVQGLGIGEAVQMELTELDAWLATIDDPVGVPLVRKMRSILSHLIEIGVGTLTQPLGLNTVGRRDVSGVKRRPARLRPHRHDVRHG